MPAMRPPQRSLPETRVQFSAVDCAAKILPLWSYTRKLTALGGCAPNVNSHDPSSWCVRTRVFPVAVLAKTGPVGVQSAPAQAVIAAASALLSTLPANDSVRLLFQLGEGHWPRSRSRTMAPMMKAMQKAATRGTRTSSTRRRVVGAAGMEPYYRTTLTVSRENIRGSWPRRKDVDAASSRLPDSRRMAGRNQPTTGCRGRLAEFALGSEHVFRHFKDPRPHPT